MTRVGEGWSSVDVDGAGTRDALADRADTTVGLTAALTGLGIDCSVEARGSLAVLTLSASSSATAGALADRGLRSAVVDAVKEMGFTHVALELRGEDG